MGFRHELDAEASYHQFFLAPLGASPVYDGMDAGTLASVVDGGTALIVLTGCTDGIVHVTVSLEDAAPAPEDSWEVQEAVSLRMGAPLFSWAPTGDFTRAVDGNPWCLEPGKPGPHRVRVSARGRGENYASYSHALPATEHYLIQIWPEERLRPRETMRDDGFGLDA